MLRSEGYHAAARATINYFTQKMGLGDIAPGTNVTAMFEAQGITNEWDMIPILLAAMLDDILIEFPDLQLGATLDETSQRVAAVHPACPMPDYAWIIREVGRRLRTGKAPAQITLEACLDGGEPCLFPRLRQFPELLTAMMGSTRSVVDAQISAVFENYALGDAIFVWSFGLLPTVRTPSYLKDYDLPLLSPKTRDRMLDMWRTGKAGMVTYTARLCLPPKGTPQEQMGYAPESELALEVLGMSEIPVVGSGRMLYLVDRLGVSPDRLIKPAPVQALSAILIGAGMEERPAIDAAGAIAYRAGLLPDYQGAPLTVPDLQKVLDNPERLDVHVFEDAPSGLWGARKAVELLVQAGLPAELSCWGVATDAVKERSLRENGAQVFPGFDDAFAAAIHKIGLV
ncbi:MAG TPA: hypothetical protein VHO48_16515 [Anaerolineaceae bacterium]|nr:hypothetical protein [Anaerolineaceae bacterium]